jgi:hypothetical protein
MDGARGAEYYKSKPRWSSGKIYIRPWQLEFEPEEKHFVSGNFAGFSLYISSERSAKLRWVGREAHLGQGVAHLGRSIAQ